MKKEEKKFEIPINDLHRLNEFSNGGFMLFLFDSDGMPQLYCNFDSAMHNFALLKHAENFVNGSNMMAVEGMVENMMEDSPSPKRRRRRKKNPGNEFTDGSEYAEG